MKNMSLEELDNFLKDKSNESIYENLQVRFPNGDIAGVQEIQQRYNDLLEKSRESEKKAANGEDLFEGVNVDDLKSILNQFYEKDIQDNLHVELSNGNVVGLEAIKKKYDEFIALSNVANHPERDFFINISDEELQSLLDNRENFDDVYLNTPVTLSNGNVVGLRDVQEELESRMNQKKEPVVVEPAPDLFEGIGIEELQSLLDNRENFDDVYLNTPVTLSNGNVVGLKDVQERYNSMADDKARADSAASSGNPSNTNDVPDDVNKQILKRLEQDEARIDQLTKRVNELEEQNKKLMEEIAKLSAVTDNRELPNQNQIQPPVPVASEQNDKGIPQPGVEPGKFEPPVPVKPEPVVAKEGDFKPPVPVDDKRTFKVTFKNGDFDIPGYTDLVVEEEQIIHGPVIDPVPLDKNGKKKKFTAKVFSGWKDQYGNDIDLSMPLNRDVVLTAQYKFDLMKAAAVGLGAAVGTAAYVADLAVPTPIPVVSGFGAAGLGIATFVHHRRLANIQHQNEVKASQISAYEEIPEELQEEIADAKLHGYFHTFLKTATVACTISAAAHGLRHLANSKVNPSVSNAQPSQVGAPSENVVQSVPSKPSPGVGATGSNATPSVPGGNVTPSVPSGNGTTTIIGDYTPNGSVYKNVVDAINGTNGLHPYFPAYEGTETFEAYFNGVRAMIKPGQSLESILESVGATMQDLEHVGVNVMNSSGQPLTWEKLTNLLVEGVEQGVKLAA